MNSFWNCSVRQCGKIDHYHFVNFIYFRVAVMFMSRVRDGVMRDRINRNGTVTLVIFRDR